MPVGAKQEQDKKARSGWQGPTRVWEETEQQAKKLKEYGALVAEMKELRDLNRRLQDVLLLRLGSGECPPSTTSHLPPTSEGVMAC